MNDVYLYVDDIREDDTWFRHHLNANMWTPIICRTFEEAIGWLEFYNRHANIIIDLDHDLGEGNGIDDSHAPSGYDICKWIVENRILLMGFHIHSLNVVGAANMRQLLRRYNYEEFY